MRGAGPSTPAAVERFTATGAPRAARRHERRGDAGPTSRLGGPGRGGAAAARAKHWAVAHDARRGRPDRQRLRGFGDGITCDRSQLPPRGKFRFEPGDFVEGSVDDATGWLLAGSPDFNRDGIPDLIGYGCDVGEVYWYENGPEWKRHLVIRGTRGLSCRIRLPGQRQDRNNQHRPHQSGQQRPHDLDD